MFRGFNKASIRAKIMAAFLVVLVSVLGFGSYFLKPKTEKHRDRLIALANVTANFMAANLDAAVEFQDITVIKSIIAQAMELRDCHYVAVAGANGEILADSNELNKSSVSIQIQGENQEFRDGYVVVRRNIYGEKGVVGSVLVSITLKEVFIQEQRHTRTLFVGCLAISVIGLAVAFMLTRYVAQPITYISTAVTRVADGDLETPDVVVRSEDEIGRLASDVNQMFASLRRFSQENATERWFKTGQAELLGKMRGEHDVADLSTSVVTYLAKYVGAQVGALYVADDDQTLRLTGTYAYPRRKHLSNQFIPGEGLVGQAALEKHWITVSELPENYITISSGLGEVAPGNIAVVPFLHESVVKGVIELAAVKAFSQPQLDLVVAVGESIAIAMSSAQARHKMRALLEKTQQQSAELHEHQKRLENANRELEEQTDALRKSEEQLKRQSNDLQTANEELEEKTEHLQRQKAEVAKQNAMLEQAKAEIEKKARDLELASRYKSEFLANMSHELRTPLNSLLILSKSLAENQDKNLTEEQVKAAKIIHGGGRELLNLINDILDLSKVEAGKLEVDLQRIEIDAVVAGLQEQFHPLSEQKRLTFLLETERDVTPFVQTDSQRAQQVLKNLLSNAFKFTEQGSVILRMHKPARETKFSSDHLSHDSAVAFSVIDTGIGIPENRQRAIFEAFQQVDGSTSRKYGGTGLGLTISRELTRLLRGELELESRVGSGSRFTLYLPTGHLPPAAQAEANNLAVPVVAGERLASPPATADFPPPDTSVSVVTSRSITDDRRKIREGDKSILIVEDDTNFATVLMDLCRQRGYKCVVASDGVTALALAGEYKPTAVLLDLGLPDVSGIQVLDQLKEDLQTRHIPVHVISGRKDGHDALEKGALSFLQKPASRDAIDSALSRVEGLLATEIRDVLVVQKRQGENSIAELLTNNSIKVTVATTPAEIEQACNGRAYHCAVFDTQGLDRPLSLFLRALRKNDGDELVPVIVYSENPLDAAENHELVQWNARMVVKQVSTTERIVDEATLFLHSVESSLTDEQRKIIRMLHDPDRVLQGRKILLVDDDMRNMFALAKTLRDRGLRILKADNGQVALERLYQEEDVELVLMDIMMPIMDGYEAMRRIRADHRFAKLPIVALTAKAMVEDRAKCLEAGANDYMTKPIDVDKLVSLLRVWLFKTV